MKYRILYTISFLTTSLLLYGQDNPFFDFNLEHCGANKISEFGNILSKRWIEPNFSLINSDSTIIVPVVVHIRHNYDYANVDIEVVREAMRQLNERYSLKNNDTINIHPEFRKRMGNPNIEFRLATIDPDGNCTSGITRSKTTSSCTDPISLWNKRKYLNITISYSGRSSIYGGAFFPDTDLFMSNPSGIVLSSRNFFKFGNYAIYFGKKTLTHEAGHYLGLPHIWAHTNDPEPINGCNIDDNEISINVFDTPNQLKATTSYPAYTVTVGKCPNYPHFSCPSEPTGDNFNNYMDYSCCTSMFTKDQARRMRTILTTYRNELTSLENLIATGTDDASQNQNCNLPPKASFAYDYDRDSAWVILSDQVHFKGFYDNTIPVSWAWTFTGGIPEKSFERNPKVSFPKTGNYKVQLIVSNQNGSDTLQENLKIFVLPGSDYYGDKLVENFETSVIGRDIMEWSWNIESNWKSGIVDFTGDQVAVRNIPYSECPNKTDYLHLPPMSLKGKKNLLLKFRTAFKGNEGANGVKGSFWVYGGTSEDLRQHTQLLRLVDSEMITTNNFTGMGQLPDSSEWKYYTISIPAQYENVENFYLSFVTNNEGGSNFYLDDIKIEEQEATSIKEATLGFGFIYPNPVKDYIYFLKQETFDKKFIIYNCLGQNIREGILSDQLDVSYLHCGLYYICIYDKGYQNPITKKFIKVN